MSRMTYSPRIMNVYLPTPAICCEQRPRQTCRRRGHEPALLGRVTLPPHPLGLRLQGSVPVWRSNPSAHRPCPATQTISLEQRHVATRPVVHLADVLLATGPARCRTKPSVNVVPHGWSGWNVIVNATMYDPSAAQDRPLPQNAQRRARLLPASRVGIRVCSAPACGLAHPAAAAVAPLRVAHIGPKRHVRSEPCRRDLRSVICLVRQLVQPWPRFRQKRSTERAETRYVRWWRCM